MPAQRGVMFGGHVSRRQALIEPSGSGRPILVGRVNECARIDRLLTEARAGTGGALALVGEPGIGKTALLRFAERRATDMTRLALLGVAAETALPYAGLGALVKPVLGGLDALPDAQSRAMRVALGAGGDGTTDALAVYAGLLALLAEAASREPVLIVVDDAHCVDPETAHALAFVARRIQDESIGILLGARSSEQFELQGVPQLPLGGLDPTAAQALIAGAGCEMAPVVARELCDAVAGNPLALLELPSVLDADQRAGRRPLGDQLTVTDSVERAFLTRMERLDEAGRWALLLAAANDGDEVETIRRAGSGAPAGLQQAEQVGLVRVQRGQVEFRHSLVRSAVYTRATDEERGAAHTALAAALKVTHRGRRAWHLAAAGSEPDAAVSGDLADAGLAARRRGACASAARLLERAAAITPSRELRAGRLLLAGEAAWLAGQLVQAEALLDRSEWLTEDPALAADVAVARWWLATSAASPEPLFAPLVARAGEISRTHPRKAAMMLAVAWDWALSCQDMDGARRLADRAALLVPSDFSADDREVLTTLAWQRLADCRVPEALQAARTVIALSEGQADLQAAYACEVLSAADHLDEAEIALSRSIAELTRVGHMPALCYALRTRATVELRQGRLLQALKTAGEALALADEGRASWPGWTDAQVAAVEAAVGVEERCRRHVDRAKQSCGGDDRWAIAEASAALGLLELGRGDDDAALVALDETDRLLRSVRHPGFVRHAADRIETLVRLGDTAGGQAALDELRRRTDAARSPWGCHVVARGRVLLAPADSVDEAYRRVRAAPIQSEFEAARTRLVYGERLRRIGRRAEARDQLRQALGTFHAVGAAPWERRAQTELRASGARLRRRDPSARDELTPQELQVALVVAEGVTNREAGARLFLSPKTIEVHLSRVYRKLGVRSRTELARRLALQGAAESAAASLRTLAAALCADTEPGLGAAAHTGMERAFGAAVQRNGGRRVRPAGDRLLATFSTATAALGCAFEICAETESREAGARAAVHVGEIDTFADGEIQGAAAEIAERVLGHAAAGEVLVTQAVRDAVYGSTLAFRPREEGELGGMGSWRLFNAGLG